MVSGLLSPFLSLCAQTGPGGVLSLIERWHHSGERPALGLDGLDSLAHGHVLGEGHDVQTYQGCPHPGQQNHWFSWFWGPKMGPEGVLGLWPDSLFIFQVTLTPSLDQCPSESTVARDEPGSLDLISSRVSSQSQGGSRHPWPRESRGDCCGGRAVPSHPCCWRHGEGTLSQPA